LLGYPETAQRHLLAVLAAQEPHAGPFDRMTGYEFCVLFYHARREWQAMQAYAQKLQAVAEEHDYTTYRWLGPLYTTAASAALGAPHGGGLVVRQSIDALKAQGIRGFIPTALCLLAEVCMHAGQQAEALAALHEALTLAAQTSEHFWDAEMYRLRGDLLAAQGMLEEAALAYQEALAIAREQQAKSLELRAALSQGRLWTMQGKRREAADLLAPTYAWFTEGFDTPDLKEAQALLAALTA
jgi:predicted ATPase